MVKYRYNLYIGGHIAKEIDSENEIMRWIKSAFREDHDYVCIKRMKLKK